jgi:hypothetical protein
VTFAPEKSGSFIGKLFGCGKEGKGARQPPRAQKPTDIINVKIKFKAVDLPEGASRALDAFNIELERRKEDNLIRMPAYIHCGGWNQVLNELK